MNEARKDQLLKNQMVLHEDIMQLSEAELKSLLKAEAKGKKRIGYFNRVYSRFSKVRRERETAQWLLGTLDL
jgi:hypothetical protein